MKKNWDEDPDSIANEIVVLDSCRHPNIVNYVKSYLWNNRVWLVMEYCDAGTLKQLLVIELSEKQIASVAKQVLEGIQFLHKSRRIHRGKESLS
jgi:serine/threonine protein kinase